eukprot:7653989-Karenia_brevis.AAC.1
MGGGVVEPPKCTPDITNNDSNDNNGSSPSGSNGGNAINGNSFLDMQTGSAKPQHLASNDSGLESKVGTAEYTYDGFAKEFVKIPPDHDTGFTWKVEKRTLVLGLHAVHLPEQSH